MKLLFFQTVFVQHVHDRGGLAIGAGNLASDESFMRLAMEEAHRALGEGEVPVGAVLVFDGAVIARAHNMPIVLQDPTAHAEILVLREAALRKRNYRLPNSQLYVTVEPCLMCAGALLQARVARLIFGAFDPKAGACGSVYNVFSTTGKDSRIVVVSGVLEKECRGIIQDFFKARR